ncbi:hypothetical protein NE237_022241 [Protea cynaroides]|uniref:RNase H type-1 domain-containing protein n=1 Tax=Protea cynaroides TaxID=273540 RepID=A0A9Q0H9D6_9MAGN|nr:hypothetical protein NE237_022241 [Protea cynaroides]
MTSKEDIVENMNSSCLPLNHWVPPQLGFMKLNIDATLTLDASKSGIGYIIRTAYGEPLLQVSWAMPFSSTAVGEALAIRTEVHDTISHGFTRLVVEMDCLDISKLLNDQDVVGDTSHFYYQMTVAKISSSVKSDGYRSLANGEQGIHQYVYALFQHKEATVEENRIPDACCNFSTGCC